MSTDVAMPKLGMTMEAGKLDEWLKSEGDQVAQGDQILIIETEKVSYEVESPANGLLHILVAEGNEVPVGKVLAVIAQDRAGYEALLTEKNGGEGTPQAPPEPRDVELPQRVSEATSAKPGHRVRIAPAARNLARQRGIDIQRITGTGPEGRITRKDVLAFEEEAESRPAIVTPPEKKKIKITPVARRLAVDRGIEVSLLIGTGPGGRITKTDVEKYQCRAEPLVEKTEPRQESVPPVAAEPNRAVRLERSELRRVVAQRMLQATQEAAQTTHSQDVDATALVEFREKLLPHGESAAGVRVTITDVVMKLTAWALKKHPILNSRFTKDEDLLFDRVHMGMAMAPKEGELLVPVLRNIEKKSLFEIARQRIDYMNRGRMGALTLDEMKGSTFTVTSLGMFGLERFVAIINRPENAILAVGAIIDKPWVYNGQVAVRKVMNTTLSYDHRTIYGVDAAKFMATLKQYIECPLTVLEEKPEE
jgi:pyruvate dehydrogenase E2 component (dihydrolipoamide acetyltransferase)